MAFLILQERQYGTTLTGLGVRDGLYVQCRRGKFLLSMGIGNTLFLVSLLTGISWLGIDGTRKVYLHLYRSVCKLVRFLLFQEGIFVELHMMFGCSSAFGVNNYLSFRSTGNSVILPWKCVNIRKDKRRQNVNGEAQFLHSITIKK